jgi:flagellar hook-length control protein FliK
MVQPAAFEAPAPDTAPTPIVAPAASSANGGGSSDSSADQRRNPDPQAAPAPEVPAGFVNPLAFSAQPVLGSDGGEAEVAVDGISRRSATAAPTTEADAEAIGPITVRAAEAAVSRAPEAAGRPTEPTPIMNTAGMSSQQLVDAVNDGAPLHFSQFQNLVQGIVASKPFVDKTVEVVLQPEGLGRIRLEVSLVDGGTAIKIAIATQSQAALGVFEAYGKNMQQIAQSQGYTLKEFDVKMTDRPIRSDSRGGQGGNDAPGQRQGRRKRRGRDDDGTV